MKEELSWPIVTAFLFGFLYIVSRIALAKKKPEKVSKESEEVVVNEAVSIAVSTLMDLGWNKSSATESVSAAVKEKPDGDYNVLINLAIKK